MEVWRGPSDDSCQQSPTRRKEPSSEWGLRLNRDSLLGEMEKNSLCPWVEDLRKHIFQKGGKCIGRKGLCPSVVASSDKAGRGQNWCVAASCKL